MKNNLIKFLIIISLVTFVTACSKDKKNEPKEPTAADKSLTTASSGKNAKLDYGKIENNTYSNDYFNIQVDLPKEWAVQTQEQSKALVEAGKKFVGENNKELQRVINASELNSVYLLTAFQHEVGAAVDFNPSFSLLAEKVDQAPGIKEGKDYLFHTKKLLEQANLGYKFKENFTRIEVDGLKFDEMETSVKYLDINISQEYYSAIDKGYALSFIVSYNSEAQKEELQKIIDSIKFNKNSV